MLLLRLLLLEFLILLSLTLLAYINKELERPILFDAGTFAWILIYGVSPCECSELTNYGCVENLGTSLPTCRGVCCDWELFSKTKSFFGVLGRKGTKLNGRIDYGYITVAEVILVSTWKSDMILLNFRLPKGLKLSRELLSALFITFDLASGFTTYLLLSLTLSLFTTNVLLALPFYEDVSKFLFSCITLSFVVYVTVNAFYRATNSGWEGLPK